LPAAADYVAIVTDREDYSATVPVLRFSVTDWLESLAVIVERRILGGA
jgi:hypothetical protein